MSLGMKTPIYLSPQGLRSRSGPHILLPLTLILCPQPEASSRVLTELDLCCPSFVHLASLTRATSFHSSQSFFLVILSSQVLCPPTLLNDSTRIGYSFLIPLSWHPVCSSHTVSHFVVFFLKYGTLHEFACHPCAGAMLIFSVSFQF